MDLVGDERAQSIQIGAVLLFAALLIAFSTYQAFVVPNQNREVEFNHNQQVQRDMIDVRNTLLETYTGGTNGYTEVTLGTTFPSRLFALNPPSPSGRLYTTDPQPIVIEDSSGSDVTTDACPGNSVETSFLVYQPSYAEYRNPGTIRYENSFLAQDFGSSTVSLTGQTLVRGETVQIVPLTRNISVGGTQTVSIEPRPGLVDTSEYDDPTVTIPTDASESTWERLLEGEVDPSRVTVNDGNLTLDLDGTYDIECGPVGLGQTPESGARGGDAAEINPAAPGDIELQDESTSSSTTTLTFNNTGGTNNITEARINFYEGSGNNPSSADISAGGDQRGNLVVGDPFTTLSPKIELVGDGTTTDVQLIWDQNPGSNEWFILTIKLETGETGLYFVPTG